MFNPVKQSSLYIIGILVWYSDTSRYCVLTVERFTGLPHVLPFGDCKPDTENDSTTHFSTVPWTTESYGTTVSEVPKTDKEIGELIARSIFEKVVDIQKRTNDPMRITDYYIYVNAVLGPISSPKVHYELSNCTLAGTSNIQSKNTDLVSEPANSLLKARGFALMPKLRAGCGGTVRLFNIRKPVKVEATLETINMKINFSYDKQSGTTEVQSLVLKNIEKFKVDMETSGTSLTKPKFLETFKSFLNHTIGVVISDVIGRDARQVAPFINLK